ncbi:transposable element Tcb2 transposase [Trichonephila clavipes]|uniref:Transposable element Tcb2 transposase n=1 Tax=Trichonephila clavipes TaxID=2585209 RepID=A0A8X6VQ20_TRICX|nr:transposable element Tcb2 transposase [Trichonephila clavipes]
MSQAEVTRNLNVSRMVVIRQWKQFQTTDAVVRRPKQGRPKATTPAEERYLTTNAHPEKTLHALLTHHRKEFFIYGAKSMCLVQIKSPAVYFSLMSPSSVPIVIPVEFSFGESLRLDTLPPSNIRESNRFSWCGILVWGGIMLDYHTLLHIFDMSSVTAQRYKDEVLESHVRPFQGAIDQDFFLWTIKANLVKNILEEEDIC